jgi:hypothetical protein
LHASCSVLASCVMFSPREPQPPSVNSPVVGGEGPQAEPWAVHRSVAHPGENSASSYASWPSEPSADWTLSAQEPDSSRYVKRQLPPQDAELSLLSIETSSRL